MNKWFEVTIKAETDNLTSGKHEKVTEKYLFDALTYTEAEARANAKIPELYKTFMITKINPIKLSEIFFNGESEYWYKCKVNYISINEKTGKEKKIPCYMYVQASDTKSAEANLHEGMKGSLSDYSIESVAETKIIDVFKYSLEEGVKKLENEEQQ